MNTAALYLIAAFALLIIALCGLGMVHPRTLIDFSERVIRSPSGMWFAAGLRGIAGVAFLLAASLSRFPTFFQIIGALSLIAAVSIPVIGQQRFVALIGWFSRAPGGVIRLWGAIGMAFGALILYACF